VYSGKSLLHPWSRSAVLLLEDEELAWEGGCLVRRQSIPPQLLVVLWIRKSRWKNWQMAEVILLILSLFSGYRDAVNDTVSLICSSIRNSNLSEGAESFLFSSVTFFLPLACPSCLSQQWLWKNFRKGIYYQSLQMFLQLATF